MKYLGPPRFNDEEIVHALAKMENLESYPGLSLVLEDIKKEYAHYETACGNVLGLNAPLAMGAELSDALKRDYNRRIVALNYIREIRQSISPDVCPMCGSLSFGQVDHVAPKSEYPEFSLFSRNLVPACSCNGKKSTNFRDFLSGGRILHPYYDEIMRDRLVYVSFEGDVPLPTLRIEVVIGHSNDAAVKFHVEKVLRRTNVLEWASKEWKKLKMMPKDVLDLDAEELDVVTYRHISAALVKRYRYFDRYYGTPNNWVSMFYYGLAASKPAFNEYLASLVANVD